MPSTCVDRSICCCSCQPLPTQNHSPLGAIHLIYSSPGCHPPVLWRREFSEPSAAFAADSPQNSSADQHRSSSSITVPPTSIAVPPTMSNGDLHSVPSTSAQCHPAVLYRREFSEPSTAFAADSPQNPSADQHRSSIAVPPTLGNGGRILGSIQRLCFRQFPGASQCHPP